MVRRYGDITNLRGSAVRGASTEFNLLKMMQQGAVPPSLLGLNMPKHGSSAFSNVAHQVQQMKAVDNLLNNGVDDQLEFLVRNKKGDAITTPFHFGGQDYRPDENGVVRLTDQANINMAMKIKKYRIKRVDDMMDIAMMGDDMASYVFGVPFDQWIEECNSGGSPRGVNMHDDLRRLDCTIEYIESLPPSITQTQSIAKLRKIVEHYEKNVNIEGLSDIADSAKNMKDGHNNPNDLSGNGPDGDSHDESKKGVEEKNDKH